MHPHYTFTAEVARQRHAEYAAQAAARRRHRAVRRDHPERAQSRKRRPRWWPMWHPWPAPAHSAND